MMYDLQWMPIFCVTSEAIRQWFLQMKIIAKSPYEWQKKSVFTVTHTLFYFLNAILCPAQAHKPARTIIDC